MGAAAWRIVLTLLSCASSGSAVEQKSESRVMGIPVVTVCEALRDLSLYNGKSIVIVGRLVGTDEGSWLIEDCESKIVTDGYAWQNIVSSNYFRSEVEPPPALPEGFRWGDKLLVTKLKQVQKATKLRGPRQYDYPNECFAFFGRFETRLPLQVVTGGMGQLMGYGFGHLNAAPAQLVFRDNSYKELKAK